MDDDGEDGESRGRDREERGRVGERGRRGAVQGGDAWFPNWVIDILQHIDLARNSNCALHVGFWFSCYFVYLFVFIFSATRLA